MHVTAVLEAPCTTDAMWAWVAALEHYPSWLSIVPRAEAQEDDEGRGAWQVDLRARIGPLARSKRLRMVRTEVVAGERVVFERMEGDGRPHGRWVMEAEVEPCAGGCRLTMDLRYDGRFGGAVIERLLADEIERSRPRLLELVSEGPPA